MHTYVCLASTHTHTHTLIPTYALYTNVRPRTNRLYKSLGDFDSLRGIFSSQVGTHPVTKETMEAEERGDYPDAVLQYKDVIGQDWKGVGPHQAEEDLWDDSLLEVGGAY